MAKVKAKAKAKAVAPARHSLSARLRDVIDSRGLTAYELAGTSGVDASVIARFLKGERDLRLATADQLAAALGLLLVEVEAKARPARKRQPS